METATACKATDLSHGEPPQDIVPEYVWNIYEAL